MPHKPFLTYNTKGKEEEDSIHLSNQDQSDEKQIDSTKPKGMQIRFWTEKKYTHIFEKDYAIFILQAHFGLYARGPRRSGELEKKIIMAQWFIKIWVYLFF